MDPDSGEYGPFPRPTYTPRLIDRLRGRKNRGKRPPPPSPPEEPPSSPLLDANPTVPRGAILPFWGGFYPSLPEGPSFQEREKAEKRERELAPIKDVLEQANNLKGSITQMEGEEAEIIRKLAQELHDKEYRAPQRPTPCGTEKQACISCYTANTKEPLRCRAAVKAFQACALRAQEDFVRATLSQ